LGFLGDDQLGARVFFFSFAFFLALFPGGAEDSLCNKKAFGRTLLWHKEKAMNTKVEGGDRGIPIAPDESIGKKKKVRIQKIPGESGSKEMNREGLRCFDHTTSKECPAGRARRGFGWRVALSRGTRFCWAS
jgi:hypothetical protein